MRDTFCITYGIVSLYLLYKERFLEYGYLTLAFTGVWFIVQEIQKKR